MADIFMSIALLPVLSEKSYKLSQERNRYVFKVPMDVNLHTVASAVTAQFKVDVEKVNMTVVKGKAKNTNRKGGRPLVGRTNTYKKAYVLLQAGQSIPIFQAEEDQEKAQAKADAKSKKRGKK